MASDEDKVRWAGRPACPLPKDIEADELHEDYDKLTGKCKVTLVQKRRLYDCGIWCANILKHYTCEADLVEMGLAADVRKALLDGAQEIPDPAPACPLL